MSISAMCVCCIFVFWFWRVLYFSRTTGGGGRRVEVEGGRRVEVKVENSKSWSNCADGGWFAGWLGVSYARCILSAHIARTNHLISYQHCWKCYMNYRNFTRSSFARLISQNTKKGFNSHSTKKQPVCLRCIIWFPRWVKSLGGECIRSSHVC